MIRFDTYRKTLKRAKLEKSFQLRNKKKFKTIFCPEVLSINPSPRLEKFCWPVIVVKLRKGQKIFKNFEKIAKFNEILLKFKTLKSYEPIDCFKRLSAFPVSSLKYFHRLKDLCTWNKFSKNLKI